MPKLKTHSGAKKRFNLTKTGKVKRAHAYKSHNKKGVAVYLTYTFSFIGYINYLNF